MIAASLATAHDTLHFAATQIAIGLAPEGRAVATSATFNQLADSCWSAGNDLPLTLADLVAGLEVVAAPLADDEAPAVAARRKTCGEIAALLRPVSPGGDPQRLAVVFRAVSSHFSGSDDPRQRAIAATAAREASEIDRRVIK